MKFHKQGFRLRGFPRAFGARAMFHLKKKYVCKIARAALPAGTTLTVRCLSCRCFCIANRRPILFMGILISIGPYPASNDYCNKPTHPHKVDCFFFFSRSDIGRVLKIVMRDSVSLTRYDCNVIVRTAAFTMRSWPLQSHTNCSVLSLTSIVGIASPPPSRTKLKPLPSA